MSSTIQVTMSIIIDSKKEAREAKQAKQAAEKEAKAIAKAVKEAEKVAKAAAKAAEKEAIAAAKKIAASTDVYTEENLRDAFHTHKEYVSKRIELKEKTGLAIRMPNMPEDISENIAKFIIHLVLGDTTSKWTKGMKGKKITGDLISEKEGTQEVKCFTSDGPPTFGPNENWDVIYFLDAREWMKERFVLWRVLLKNSSPEWKGLKMNKTKGETYAEHGEQKRRPRIAWDSIRLQLGEHAQPVFDGTFDSIFTHTEAESSGSQSV